MTNITPIQNAEIGSSVRAKMNAAILEANKVGGKVDQVVGKQLSTEDYTPAEKQKLESVQFAATANQSDAHLKDRANHTGEQPISTVAGLQLLLDQLAESGMTDAELARLVAVEDTLPNKADLEGGKLALSQMPDIAAGRKITVADEAARLALDVWPDLTIAYQADNGNAYAIDANSDPAVIGNWSLLGGGIATGVTSFNSRTGEVLPQTGDYTAEQITETTEKQFVSTLQKAEWTAKETVAGAQAKATAAGQDAKDYADLTFIEKTQKGSANGVATLNESGELTENQLPLKTINGESIRGDGNLVIEGGGLTPEQEAKLDSVQFGATVNQTDAVLLSRGNHTGTQDISTINNLSNTLDNKVDKVIGKELSDNNLTDALLTLLNTKKVKNVTTDAVNDKLVITYTDDTTAELNVNDIVTDIYVSGATLDATTNVLTLTSANGGADVTVDLSDFVNSSELASALATKVDKVTGSSLVADTKVIGYDNHIASTANPHSVTKAQVGLSNVDNTSDVNKPVSTATQTALDTKAGTTGGGASGTWDINITGNAGTVTDGVYTTGNQTIDGVKTYSSRADFRGGLSTQFGDNDGLVRIAYPADWSTESGSDHTAIKIQTVEHNGTNFPYGVVGIRFATSTSDGYGPFIGATRTGTGNGDFVIKTGDKSVIERFRIADNGNATFTNTVTAPTFSGDLSGNATTATTASAVDWGDITSKPTTFTPTTHNHNNIYYTKTEVNTALDTKVSKITSTDNAIVKFNGTNGEVQDSTAILSDGGVLSLATSDLSPLNFDSWPDETSKVTARSDLSFSSTGAAGLHSFPLVIGKFYTIEIKGVSGAPLELRDNFLSSPSAPIIATIASGDITITFKSQNGGIYVRHPESGTTTIESISVREVPITLNGDIPFNNKVSKVTSTNNAIVKFNGNAGEVQNSGVIINDSDNVGIGINSPAHRLDVNVADSGNIPIVARFRNADTQTENGSGSKIRLGGTTLDRGVEIVGANDVDVGSTAHYLAFNTSSQASPPSERLRITPRGNLLINTTTDNVVDKLQVDGSVRCTSLTQTSDYSLKTNIEDIDSASVLLNLKPREYTLNSDGRKHYGFIAQELDDYLPILVSGSDGSKSVNYIELIPLLVKSIQELSQEIEILKGKQK